MRTRWTRLCSEEDLADGDARVFEVDGFTLAAARSGSRVFVVENRCSHDDGPLGEGKLVRSREVEIECPRHGGRFDLTTGKATRMPAVTPIRCFTAKVEGDDIWVDLPEEGP
jgi:3-phenylpropionate/trans-cinnamate dioxygenase ferredoxin component